MTTAVPDAPTSAALQTSDDRPVVCEVVHGLPVGGAEVLVDRFVRGMSDEFRLVVACLDEVGTLGEGLAADGHVVENLRRRPGLDLGCARRLGAFLRRHAVDVMHAHQCTPFFYARLARGVTGRTPIVFTEHGRFHPDLRSPKRVLFNRASLRRRDRYVAVGDAVARALVEIEGLPSERVETVYNGIDLSPFRDRPAGPPAPGGGLRSSLGLGEDDFVVIQVARLDPIKDHRTAVAAVARVRESHPDVKLLIVGDGPERDAIASMIVAHGVDESVRMLGTRRDVADLLGVADAFLLTSLSEGIPLTVIEALAAGVPVVTTDVGGVGEVLGEPPVGLTAPAGDPEKLASALGRLRGDPSVRARLIDRGRERAFAEFDESKMHGRYREFFRAAAGTRR